MKRILLCSSLLVLSLLSLGCSQQGQTNSLASDSIASADSLEGRQVLIGKTLLLDYGTMKVEVRYDSDSVYWRTMTPEGQLTGQDREIPSYEALGGDRFFVTWQEADGTAVTQIVDLKEGTVMASVLDPAKAKSGDRTPLVLVGTAKEVNQAK